MFPMLHGVANQIASGEITSPLTLYPTNDTYIRTTEGSEQSAATTLQIYKDIAKTLLLFDLSSLVGKTITAAKLSLTTSSYAGGTPNVQTFRVSNANVWLDDEALWTQRQTSTSWAGSNGLMTSGTDYDSTACHAAVTVSTTSETTYDLTFDSNGIAHVQDMVDGVVTNNGFVLQGDQAQFWWTSIHSVEDATESYRPKLIIEFS